MLLKEIEQKEIITLFLYKLYGAVQGDLLMHCEQQALVIRGLFPDLCIIFLWNQYAA